MKTKDNFEKFVILLIVLYVGFKTLEDVWYHYLIKNNRKLEAFIFSPIRYFKYNGKTEE